jgi:hypothetical protein
MTTKKTYLERNIFLLETVKEQFYNMYKQGLLSSEHFFELDEVLGELLFDLRVEICNIKTS